MTDARPLFPFALPGHTVCPKCTGQEWMLKYADGLVSFERLQAGEQGVSRSVVVNKEPEYIEVTCTTCFYSYRMRPADAEINSNVQ